MLSNDESGYCNGIFSFSDVLTKIDELPKKPADDSFLDYFNQNSIEKIINFLESLPNNPFSIDTSQSTKQNALGISSKIEKTLPFLRKVDEGIVDDLIVAGVIAFIGIPAFPFLNTKPVLIELLSSTSQLIRSSALLTLFAREENDFPWDINDLNWAIERRLFFAYPLRLFGKILICLRKALNNNQETFEIFLAKHSHGNPYSCGGSEFSDYKALEMMLFFVEMGYVNRDILDKLMWRNEAMNLDSVEEVYVCRIRKLLAKKMQTSCTTRDLIIQKILQECGTEGDTPGGETDGWFRMLMLIDPKKAEVGTLQVLINLIHGVTIYYVSQLTEVIVHFLLGQGVESRQAKVWLLKEIASQSQVEADPDYVDRLLRGIRNSAREDREVINEVQNLSRRAKSRSVRDTAKKYLERGWLSNT